MIIRQYIKVWQNNLNGKMSSILDFKREAIAKGLCKQYRNKWDNAQSKKDLVDIALDANGIEYMAEMLNEGWGLTPEHIHKEFADYINGRYEKKHNGYKTAMYVMYNGELTTSCTAYLLASCNIKVVIPKNCVCRLFICAGSNVMIDCEGDCEVYCYEDKSQVREITGAGSVDLK